MADQTNKTPNQSKIGLMAEIVRNLRLVWRLLGDPRVSLLSKLIVPGLAGLYLLWPADMLPDVLPVLGQLDDLALLALAIKLFVDFCPPLVVRQHRDDITAGRPTSHTNPGAPVGGQSGTVVDGDYRIIE